MSRKAVLFDIDGTLMRADGAGRKALAQSAAQVLRLPNEAVSEHLEQVDFRGATDRSIIAELSTRLQRQIDEDALLPQYVRVLERTLAAATITILPGALQAIELFERLAGTHVGLLTGNFRSAARQKLHHLGLAKLAERPGGFGEDGFKRAQLAEQARDRLAALGIQPHQTLVIGDTQHDVACAHHIGAPAVAVATGWTERSVLVDSGAQLVLDDLSDPTPLLNLLQRL